MAVRNVWIFLSASLIVFQKSDALTCFQCGDSSITGECVTDTATMEAEFYAYNTSLSNGESQDDDYKYIKRCSGEDNACIIERIEEQGQTHAYLRDCFHLGTLFSLNSTRFDNLVTNLAEHGNQSSCMYDSGSKRMACVLLCNTDLCNGPQIDSATSYHRMRLSLVLTVILTWMSM